MAVNAVNAFYLLLLFTNALNTIFNCIIKTGRCDNWTANSQSNCLPPKKKNNTKTQQCNCICIYTGVLRVSVRIFVFVAVAVSVYLVALLIANAFSYNAYACDIFMGFPAKLIDKLRFWLLFLLSSVVVVVVV